MERGQHRTAWLASLCLIVACSDSRVSPSVLFQAEPGDLFVVRNVANMVPPQGTETDISTLAAVEYGVLGLEVEHVIVLGHSRCGGIHALLEGPEKTAARFPHVTEWVSPFVPVRQAALEESESGGGEPARCLERAALVQSLENLRAYPWIAERVAAGKLTLHGWYFRLGGGVLEAYDPASGRFESLVGEPETAS